MHTQTFTCSPLPLLFHQHWPFQSFKKNTQGSTFATIVAQTNENTNLVHSFINLKITNGTLLLPFLPSCKQCTYKLNGYSSKKRKKKTPKNISNTIVAFLKTWHNHHLETKQIKKTFDVNTTITITTYMEIQCFIKSLVWQLFEKRKIKKKMIPSQPFCICTINIVKS
jgi:hypothetical protein